MNTLFLGWLSKTVKTELSLNRVVKMAALDLKSTNSQETKNKGDPYEFYEDMKLLVNNEKYRYIGFFVLFSFLLNFLLFDLRPR